METTRFVDRMKISKTQADELIRKKLRICCEEYVSEFELLLDKIENIYEKQEFFIIEEKHCFIDVRDKFIFFDLNSAKGAPQKIESPDELNLDKISEKNTPIEGLAGKLPTLKQLRKVRKIILESDNASDKWYLSREGKCYNPMSNDSFGIIHYIGVYAIPVIDLSFDNSTDLLINILIPYELCPKGLSAKEKELFSDLILLKKINKEYGSDSILYLNNTLKFKIEQIWEDFMENSEKDIYQMLHWRLTEVLKVYNETRSVEGEINVDVKEKLLQCEKIRADIEPYEARILTDPNRGHWDLWRDQSETDYTVKIAEKLVARNPVCDINQNGVIAVDFGTKSTIVVFQSDIEHSLPMRIGDGNLSKGVSVKQYENPTVMHFVNLAKFIKEYNSQKGRPNTEWNDLTISHTAMDQFSTSSSEEYYEYLHQIKQWAGQREKQFRIQPHMGESIVLPSFMDLKDEDVNPIEIYAYYIGLYINNMRHGIFLDYYLSFPVTYEVKIRKKIVESFEKGLKKSLPETLLNDQEIMSKFRVNGDISEPAAYAVCALQEYGFDPMGDEEIFYGIFDFGGGTTDFDFGLWKQSAKRRYDYTIENFGAGGDEFLGGENLLEMLAFEIFKRNQNFMREKGYTFTLAPKCKEFLGSDALLSDSQEAEKNMHNLMEVLRPYWEEYREPDDSEEEEPQAGMLMVTLFDREGNDHVNEELEFSLYEINQFIEDKIREGVNNFFSALMLSYQNEKVKKPSTVNILLAGNSSKSPIVRKVFEEEIERHKKVMKEKYPSEGDVENLFEIFPPLGTEEAYQKMEERGIYFERDNFEKPTGKTGVAFGLLQCRKGGNIERISNVDSDVEIPFQYFIGWRIKKKFVIFKDDSKITKYMGKPDYNVWYKFIEANEEVFDLYYTTLPECVNGNTFVDGNAAVKRHRCNLDIVNENAFVYIRSVGPHTLEYVVAASDDVENSMLGEIIRKELG